MNTDILQKFISMITSLFLSGLIAGTSIAAAKTFDSTTPPIALESFLVDRDYELKTIASELSYPWSIALLPDGDYLVTLREGSLHVISQSGEVSAAIANTPATYVRNQGGFFDVLVDKNFSTNQTIFLSFAHGTPGTNATRILKATLDVNALSLNEVETVFTVSPTKDTPSHYGGRMIQLDDGSLVMTTGDGFQYREAAQDPFSQLGKIVRLNTDGSAPSDNPFADGKSANPYVYSMGHRSPQGLTIDSAGRIFMNEHGARGGDEINLVKAGENYGWPKTTHGVNYSGALVSPYKTLPGITAPLLHWTPSIAPSGLSFYEDDKFPALKNCLLTGGLVSRDVRCAKLENGEIVAEYSLFSEIGERIRDVRVSPGGTLLLLTDSKKGAVIEVVPPRAP